MMRSYIATFVVAICLSVSVAGPALAESDELIVKYAWARATPGAAQTAAAYVMILSASGDRLIGASTPVAQKLHTMTMDGNVMKMRQVDGIDLPAGKLVTLQPGGYHIMLTGLTQALTEGQTFALTLTFEKAGVREVSVAVQKVGSMGPGMNMPGMDMPMHH